MEVSFLHFSLDSESKGLVDFYPGLVQLRSRVQSSWKLVSLAYYCPWAQPLPRVPGHPPLLTDELDPSLGMDLCKSISVRKIVRHRFSAECDLPVQRTCKPGVPPPPQTHTFSSREKVGEPTAWTRKERSEAENVQEKRQFPTFLWFYVKGDRQCKWTREES